MKVWVYVEGESDKLALNTLWNSWRIALSNGGHGIAVIPLNGKQGLLKRIGPRAAEKLKGSGQDLVVGLPDLYPNRVFDNTAYKHANLTELQQVQRKQVETALKSNYGLSDQQARQMLARFYPTALKHDLEMLLLAALNELRGYLGTAEKLGKWRNPVEEQNQDHPPKRVVEELFLTKSRKRRAYRDTFHAPAILRKVTNLKTIIYNNNNQVNCPVFKATLDWIGERTGAPAYQ